MPVTSDLNKKSPCIVILEVKLKAENYMYNWITSM